jgi:hypothetical protein
VSADFAPFCVNHPGVAPRGLCARCRVAFCADCLTKVDGVNHCARCYTAAAQADRARAAERAPEVAEGRLALTLVGLWLLVWGVLELGFGPERLP